MASEDFEYGIPHVNRASGTCCGKPGGCTNPDPGCLYRDSPRKLRPIAETERLRRESKQTEEERDERQ